MNKLRLTVWLLLLCGSATLAQNKPSAGNPEQLFARAAALQQAGKLEEAVRAWQVYLAQQPAHLEARSNLGATLARLGRYAEAIEQYQRALALDEKHPGIRFNLAVAFYKAGRPAAAAAELARVVALQPGNHNAALLLADCYLQLGEHKKVIELLTPRSAERTEDRALAYLLGTALIRDQQVAAGQVWIERILRFGGAAEAHLLLGTTHLLAAEAAEAVKELEQAVKLNPNLPGVHSYYGRALLLLRETEQARAEFQRELANNPNDYEANLQLGLLAKQEQQWAAALNYFQRALQLRPGEPNARFYLANARIGLGKLNEALPELEQLVKDAPTFVEAHVLLASVYYRLKRKADGDRAQAIVKRLHAEQQANQPRQKSIP